jgi:hypothetical protein
MQRFVIYCNTQHHVEIDRELLSGIREGWKRRSSSALCGAISEERLQPYRVCMLRTRDNFRERLDNSRLGIYMFSVDEPPAKAITAQSPPTRAVFVLLFFNRSCHAYLRYLGWVGPCLAFCLCDKCWLHIFSEKSVTHVTSYNFYMILAEYPCVATAYLKNYIPQ